MMLELNHFYNMDCMEGMKQFPDKYFELAIVDPPYGINAANMKMGTNMNRKDGHGNGTSAADRLKKGRLNAGAGNLKDRALQNMNCDWDFQKPDEAYFKELFRVSQNQIIWGGNYFDLPPTRGIVCWDKLQPWENFSQFELAWTSFDKPAALFRYSTTGSRGEKKIHPTQKPIALYTWLLQKYAKGGDKIIDTHVGSASSLIAFYQGGFNFVGFEIDPDYYMTASNRLEAVMAQQSLFREAVAP
jgi:site-specific DNA-methyltransferase (adenine-specific)